MLHFKMSKLGIVDRDTMNHSRSILVLDEQWVCQANFIPVDHIAMHQIVHGSAGLTQLDLRRTIQEIQYFEKGTDRRVWICGLVNTSLL